MADAADPSHQVALVTLAGFDASGFGATQCLDRRIATQERLVSEIAAWERQRNASAAQIKWMFTTEKAGAKIGRAYLASCCLQPTEEVIITVQRY